MAVRVDDKREIEICGHKIPPGTPIIHALAVASESQEFFKKPEE